MKQSLNCLIFFVTVDGFCNFIVSSTLEYDENDHWEDQNFSDVFFTCFDRLDDLKKDEHLNDMRYTSDAHVIYLGFIYEDNPTYIEEGQLDSVTHVCSDMQLNKIFNHLEEIGYESNNNIISKYKKAAFDLKNAKLVIGVKYKTNSGKSIIINSFDFSGEIPKYDVTITEKKEQNSGTIDIQTLKNYIYYPEIPFPKQ